MKKDSPIQKGTESSSTRRNATGMLSNQAIIQIFFFLKKKKNKKQKTKYSIAFYCYIDYKKMTHGLGIKLKPKTISLALIASMPRAMLTGEIGL